MRLASLFKEIRFSEVVLYVSLLAAGTFHEYVSCGVSVALMGYLIYRAAKTKEIRFTLNLTSVSLVLLPVAYAFTCMYAIDSGMGFVGFLKFLPVCLYMLVLMQEKGSGEHIIKRLPYVTFVVSAVSFVCMFVPVLSEYFAVAERMAGFFQYPNTFALVLLVSELVIVSKKKITLIDGVVIAGLLFFIFYTGSRTVFVLTIISNILIVFLEKGKIAKIIIAALLGVAAVAVALLFPVLSESDLFGRFFTISVFESTFVGRLLYFYDSLPLILRHPFGLGYMGYSYVQQSVQTGVYSVRYIHNDFLQIMLDVGWIPCALFISAIVKSLFNKKTEKWKKVIISVIFLHSCFDFNLQFVSVFFIFILFLDYESGKDYTYKKCTALCVVSALLSLLSLYFGISLGLSAFGLLEASQAMYPGNTQNNIALIMQEDDIAESEKLADRIMAQNKYVQPAYNVKSLCSYSQGDFESLIYYKNETFRIAPFAYEEYEEYCYMLMNGIMLYEQAGDSQSADYCRKEFSATYKKMQALPDRLSKLGSMIDDQPVTYIPDDIVLYAKALEG